LSVLLMSIVGEEKGKVKMVIVVHGQMGRICKWHAPYCPFSWL
jgi:hypothetical protein